MITLNTRRLADLEQTLTGDGAISITSNVMTASATGVGDRAYVSRYVEADAGASVDIELDANVTSGTLSLIVDIVDKDAVVVQNVFARLDFTDYGWNTRRMTVTMPLQYSQGYAFKVNFGVFNQESGSGEFADFRVQVRGGRIGSPSFLACGLIERNPAGSTIKINSKYISHGIESVTYNSSTDKIEVVVDESFMPNLVGSRTTPLPSVAFTQEVAGSIVPRVGGVNRVTRTWFISFTDVTTGSFVAMPTGPWFMTFTLMGY